MKLLYTKLFFLIILFTGQLAAQENNDYKFYDDGGESSRRNAIIFDLASIYYPYYVIGYQRDLSNNAFVSGGFLFLQKDKLYRIPLSGFELDENARFYKAEGKPNLFINANYCTKYERGKWKKVSSATIGYQLIHLDSVNINDFYFRKSIVSYEYKNLISISLHAEVGGKLVKFVNPHFSLTDWKYIKSFWTFHYHLPMIIGVKF